MAKLYFRYGTMGSGKSLNLLAVAHTYRQQRKDVLLIKPKRDTRFGARNIKSRAGIEMLIDLLIEKETNLLEQDYTDISCILVDEAHFIEPHHIDQLRDITLKFSLPVICYGLRTDFQTKLFPGAKRLMELADSIEELKSTCYNCNKKSIINMRHSNGKVVLDGPSIKLGAEDLYHPVCYGCFAKQVESLKDEKAYSSTLE